VYHPVRWERRAISSFAPFAHGAMNPTACSPCCSHTSRRIAGGKPCLLKIVSWAARKLSKVLPARDTPHQAVSYTHTRLLQRSSAVGKSPAAWSPQALCALLLIPAAACRLPRR
jgi:hypothetical protein